MSDECQDGKQTMQVFLMRNAILILEARKILRAVGEKIS
jgi:hypothetical protein